jgi:hypothetical protein
VTRPVEWFLGFPNVAAHFKPMQKRPSFKKLLAYGKELNDGVANSAKATIDSCRLTLLPGRMKEQARKIKTSRFTTSRFDSQ